MSFTTPYSSIETLGDAPHVDGFTRAGDAAQRVVEGLALKMAARALVDRNCQYDGPNIVIPCASHSEAIRLVADLRRALEAA